jgi:DNA polymerase-3 subunit epsilon
MAREREPEMTEESAESRPQRGVLLRRAYEALNRAGEALEEEALLQQVFGAVAGGARAPWVRLLRELLGSSSLFTRDERGCWQLRLWQEEQRALSEVDFVVIDVETSGLRPGRDRLIEVAALRLRGGVMLDRFQSLLNPERRLPPSIVALTGITPEMLAAAPAVEAVLPAFLRFIEGATLVGHNLAFDIHFLAWEAQRLSDAMPLDGIDTIALARRLLPGLRRFKLDHLAAHLQIAPSTRHRARADAETTAAIFLQLLALAHAQGIETLGQLRLRLQLPVAWRGDLRALPAEGPHLFRPGPERLRGSLLLNRACKRDFPARPGVYLMKDEDGQVIYVGKAKSLKERLASYYRQSPGYSRKMDGLLQNVREIETRVLGSELEALLVESQLIKELQPAYNVQLRNYESYPFIKIDVQQPFPRVYATREVAADGARYFGPFRSGRLVELTLELVHKLFPVRTCTRALPPQARASAPCLRFHLGRCPAPCSGQADPAAYRATIEEVCAFLGGEREDLLARVRRQMYEAARQMHYERAAWLRDLLRSTEEALIGQQLISGAVEANNLFIIYPSTWEGQNEIFLIRHGRLIEQRRVPHEEQAMRSAIAALLARAAALGAPPTVVGQAEVDQINIISRWIQRHSQDRAFFPFKAALHNPGEAEQLMQRIWQELTDLHRNAPEPAEDRLSGGHQGEDAEGAARV